ncbi:MAG TPA: hypothetical protein VFW94_23345 [Candidatus Acidoferrales bacterium]|nr:hypothetical protein [Candidatus Acidoferrales bacterium]
MPEYTPEKKRSPSETLMGALEDIDDCQEVMIVKVNRDGSIEWHCTTDSIHKKIGMVDFVRECIVRRAFQDD